jgi:hypothetical protein
MAYSNRVDILLFSIDVSIAVQVVESYDGQMMIP